MSCIAFQSFFGCKAYDLLAFFKQDFFHEEVRVEFPDLVKQIVPIVVESQAL